MKNILAGFLCVCLCIAVAIFLPQTGTSNELVDETGCLAAECHVADFGEGSFHGIHGDDCAACHEGGTGQLGNVSSSSCVECHPVGDPGACNLVNQHEDAGASCLECHEDCAVAEGCTVTIDCETTELCPDDDCTTCSAATVCDGATTGGTYTWELNGTVTTGNSVEVCPSALNDGSNTVTATDTANGDVEDTETIEFNGSACQEPTECIINVIVESLPKSNWFALPLFFRIETVGIDPTLLTPVNIACEADEMGALGLASVLKTGKVIIPSFGTTPSNIFQTVIVWPTWVTQSGGMGSETCTVTVGDCGATDTFELNYLPFFLSE